MSKHTPGPWALHCDGTSKTLTGADHYNEPYVAVVGSDGKVVCDNAHYYAQQVSREDMRLIAAAPDLLDALEAFERIKDIWLPVESEEQHAEEMHTLHMARNSMLAAIARAKGESQ